MNVTAFPPPSLLQVRDLAVHLADGTPIVSDISLTVAAGRILGLVGESGSGKTTIGSALLGHARPGARIAGGAVIVDGLDILGLAPPGLPHVRGRLVGHVPQDPAMALNPMLRIGTHLHELLEVHEPALARKDRNRRILEVLADVGLPGDTEFLRRFPHQLSGGQQQRILLALAFILKPKLVVLDEPTTALDASTQAHVMQTIRTLCRSHQVAAVYVSHDLGAVQDLADDLIVLYAGRIVEAASRDILFAAPAHPYTRGLLSAVPDVDARRVPVPIPGHAPTPHNRPFGCAFAPRCAHATDLCAVESPSQGAIAPAHSIACFHALPTPLKPQLGERIEPLKPEAGSNILEVSALGASHGDRAVLSDIAFSLAAGRCSALIGESGSGKTTLARTLAGLAGHAEGSVHLAGREIALDGSRRTGEQRRKIQYVFQNPYRALNPRLTVGQTLGTATRHFFGASKGEARDRARSALERVALPAGYIDRYPRELSGGERQRVAIARALICEPDLLICDEVTSALDVSVQAAILQLLLSLQESGLTIFFVTHDLAVVRAIADHVLVLHLGRIVEHGRTDDVFTSPAHPYTRQLLAHNRSNQALVSHPAISG